jgi:hypothetical protein
VSEHLVEVQAIRRECERFVKLMDDPHPGLFTWQEFFWETIRELHRLTADALTAPKSEATP